MRNADGKTETNKQKKARNLSFKSLVGPFTYIQNVMPIVGTVTLNPVIPFINVTETRTFRSSASNARMLGALLLWV